MVSTVKQFFEKFIRPASTSRNAISAHALRLATAVLLVEMMRSDMKITEDERDALRETVQSKFNLSHEETEALILLAKEKVHESTSFHEFTSLLNKGFTREQRIRVIRHLWEIAYADRELDKHEEHMVRKIADLLYVPHRDFIEMKLKVRDGLHKRGKT
ncbi:MAG: TerB family tellurite resistance protein [bacterium]